ncbi:MAG: glycoside hydrolase family 16 protein [Opitutaceae bacterium]
MRLSKTFPVVLTAVLSGLAAGFPFAHGALVWSDEFDQSDGSGPDPSKWVHDLGAGGWGNNELQTYTNERENSFVVNDPAATDGKALAIRAIKSAGGAHTSARIKTLEKFSTTHGRLEARMKLTKGRGLWPAFWALGANIESVGWPARSTSWSSSDTSRTRFTAVFTLRDSRRARTPSPPPGFR